MPFYSEKMSCEVVLYKVKIRQQNYDYTCTYVLENANIYRIGNN